MAEQNETNQQEQTPPVFRLMKMYIKDLSYENPNAPDIFMAQQAAPKVDVNLGLKNKKISDDQWEVSLSITTTIKQDGDEGKTLFIAEVDHAGLFLLQNIPEQHLPMVLAVDCPTLIFPFTRQILSQISVDGGFIPFLMEPVNFMALYQNAQKQKEAQKTQ